MVKSYLRYEPRAVFGVIASFDSNICFDAAGKQLLAPALESVNIWNLKQGICSKALTPALSGPSLAVTSIASSPSSLIASGYADGSIRIWDINKGACETTLNGHKSATTALRYNKLGSLLASGSKDCDIILWDVVGEAGLYRLRGHRDQVTDLVFLDSAKKLVSCSKDKFIRVWDLDTQYCAQIISGHRSEIWSMDVDPKEKFLVTGSADPELRFYLVNQGPLDSHPGGNGDPTQSKWEILKQFGEIHRQNKDSKDRMATVRFNKSGNLLGCQEAGKTVELYRVLDDHEAKHKAKRRINRKKEKLSSEEADGDPNLVKGQETNVPDIVATDCFKFLILLKASKKISSFSFCPNTPKNGALASLALSLNNNLLEVYSVHSDTTSKVLSIDLPGHRSDIRSVSLSSDNTLLMSTSHNAVKIWNPSTGSCLRTIESGYGLCGALVPGNRYGLVGTKGGKLEIIDVGSANCIDVIEAHSDSVGSIGLIPDGTGFVTASIDHYVKFWEYQLKEKPGQNTKELTVLNVGSYEMNDEVTVVSVSPDAKYIAVALLDYTVKSSKNWSFLPITGGRHTSSIYQGDRIRSLGLHVCDLSGLDFAASQGAANPDLLVLVFFLDTMKFFLSLYGHKLPVLGMDISADGDLIVTGSADKNLKIWGLDFGDCHKSIFAHSDSVMAIKFVNNTHYMFSVGKDRLVKYWDADKFELLLTLEGHHSYIWCLAISNRGDFLVTGSNDRSIRRWDRTEEPFFIEEEKEKRLEEIFESAFDDSFESRHVPKVDLPEEGAVTLAGKKTKETLTSTDLIIDALDMAEEELKRISQHKAEEKSSGQTTSFQPNVLMLGLSPSDYVLRALSNVQTNDLEQTLLALPFSDALKLMSYLKDWVFNSAKVELVSRVATVLLQIHHNQLISTPSARPLLTQLKDLLHQRVKECKDIIGFNLAAMDHLKQLMSFRSDAPFRDAKTKLLEIRSWHSKRHEEKTQLKNERKRKKKKT